VKERPRSHEWSSGDVCRARPCEMEPAERASLGIFCRNCRRCWLCADDACPATRRNLDVPLIPSSEGAAA
jgi:hypothetical protein